MNEALCVTGMHHLQCHFMRSLHSVNSDALIEPAVQSYSVNPYRSSGTSGLGYRTCNLIDVSLEIKAF